MYATPVERKMNKFWKGLSSHVKDGVVVATGLGAESNEMDAKRLSVLVVVVDTVGTLVTWR